MRTITNVEYSLYKPFFPEITDKCTIVKVECKSYVISMNQEDVSVVDINDESKIKDDSRVITIIKKGWYINEGSCQLKIRMRGAYDEIGNVFYIREYPNFTEVQLSELYNLVSNI